ncbi:MAG: hypothetical protein AAB853_04365, partial [Patescibacteria group bacterium]
MSPLHWQDASQGNPQTTAMASTNPWFAITMGLLGLIVGFAVHRFFIPETLGAQVTSPPLAQGIVVPSLTPPSPVAAGGGCGFGGGCGCGAAV